MAKRRPGTMERLEWVRERMGYPDLKAFWRVLGGVRLCSYEAARRYHTDRKAPTSYLAAVARVCGVRIAWLVSGEAPAFAEPAPQPVSAGVDVPFDVLGYLDRFPQLTPAARWPLVSLLNEVRRQDPRYWPDGAPAWERFIERLEAIVAMPLTSPALLTEAPALTEAELVTYAHAMVAALRPLIPALRPARPPSPAQRRSTKRRPT